MPVRVIRLGSLREPGEGLRIGTVRRPPRGVPKDRHASDDWFDVWFPVLAPSAALMQVGKGASSARDWANFVRRFSEEMSAPVPARTLDLLALLSHRTSFSIGCYCEDETRCHRSVLRRLLADRGAAIE